MSTGPARRTRGPHDRACAERESRRGRRHRVGAKYQVRYGVTEWKSGEHLVIINTSRSITFPTKYRRYTQHAPRPSLGADIGVESCHLSAIASYTSTTEVVSRPSKPPIAKIVSPADTSPMSCCGVLSGAKARHPFILGSRASTFDK